ncbi:MAG TPA: PAS domain-containing sensor histidine kinase, partial [Methanomassiliicoccales archaeon]|nr:PAS domain-containing sensor histidine kinase [Methanomassiliicoccales archaeon]
GVFQQCNPALAEILGYDDVDEVVGVPISSIYIDVKDRETLLTDLATQRQVMNRRVRLRRKDGTIIIANLTLQAKFDEDGHIEWIDGVLENITDMELSEEALRQANKKLNLLSSITRHDIVNQVFVLEGYLTLAIERVHDERVQVLLQKVKDSASSIERQMAFTKDYQDIGVKAPQWFVLRDVIFNSLLTVDKSALRIQINVGDYEIFADPMVSKVFYNLVDNATKHSQAHKLFITTQETDDGLSIVFQDDGQGITNKEKLFRHSNSRSGYGLFLSREILSITGLTITETGEKGEGARFEILVPPNLYRR